MRSSSVGPLLHTGTEARAVTMETYCFAKCGPNEMIFKKIDVGVFCIVTPISSCAGDMLNPPSPSPLPLFTTPPPRSMLEIIFIDITITIMMTKNDNCGMM